MTGHRREGNEVHTDPQFDLRRATPPFVETSETAFAASVRATLSSRGLFEEMHAHRFAGTSSDREAGAIWLSPRLKRSVDPNQVLVTSGAQICLLILLRYLVGRGSILLCEARTYPQLRALAEIVGVTLRPVEMDGEGVRPDAFESACADGRVKAAYLIPTAHNPTATTLSAARRSSVAAVAQHHGVQIIEDEAQALLCLDAPRPQ